MQQNQLLSLLSDAEEERLKPYLHEVDLVRNTQLLTAGQPMQSVWFLNDGVTSTLVDSPDGETIEVGLMGYEGMVGLSAVLGRAVSSTTVIVQIAGRATRMAFDDFQRYVVREGGELHELVLRYADAFMAMVAQTAACNSLHNVEERLARWILMTQDRVERNEIPLTQEYLAFMLGVRRPSVSLAAGILQTTGVIKYTRGQISVLDRPRLEELSCPCYAIVRSIVERMYATPSKDGPASSPASSP